MKGAIGLVIGLLVPALLAMSGSVAAQEKGVAAKVMTTKVLENDRVLVIENRFAPGAENANVPRNARVVRALTSGTLQRTYPDGKVEKVEWKAGDTQFLPAAGKDAPQYVTKNIGNTELVLYLVVLK
jgi:hypothetical protein